MLRAQEILSAGIEDFLSTGREEIPLYFDDLLLLLSSTAFSCAFTCGTI